MNSNKVTDINTVLSVFGKAPKFSVLVLDVYSEELISDDIEITLAKASSILRDLHKDSASTLTFAKIILDGTDDGNCIILYPPNNPVEIWISKQKAD